MIENEYKKSEINTQIFVSRVYYLLIRFYPNLFHETPTCS